MGEADRYGTALDPRCFPAGVRRVVEAIESVRGRGGESYTVQGRLGYRNPVKPDTAPCLTALTRTHRPTRILELGTGYGFSTLHFALADTAANVVTVEMDPVIAKQACRTFADAGLDYRVYTGGTGAAIDELPAGIDMVFIDHQPSMYLPDLRHLEPKLSAGAVVLADNVNDRRAENADFVAYVLGTYGGVVLPTQAGLLYSTLG